ncbi:MAG TPA: porin family protein [Mucilaginibacter sp.]|jgi:hypothetical protein
MKKIIITLILAATVSFASAQVLPFFQLGLKGGANFSSLSSPGTMFSSSNQAGYLAGVWARFGALGFNFQPEIYATSKNVEISGTNGGKQTYTSVDVPLLFGGKFGALGLGGRFYTGPLVSFAIDKGQTFFDATGKAVSLNFHDQNYAWQFGAGLDIQRISIDLRYEAGITDQHYNNGGQTKINIFNISLAYRLLKL